MANTQNLASGTLAEDVTASATMILVYVGDGGAPTIKAVWPTAPFFITVMPHNPVAGVSNSMDSEIMKVTAVGNDQVGNVALTVTRAQKGTTAKAFNSGSIVTNGIYVEDLGISYSTDEVETAAKWVDGKTIYKKTINFGSLPNSTIKEVPHNISNLGYIVEMKGITYNGTRYADLSAPGINDPGRGIQITATSTNVIVTTGFDRTNDSAYITLYYTKSS